MKSTTLLLLLVSTAGWAQEPTTVETTSVATTTTTAPTDTEPATTETVTTETTTTTPGEPATVAPAVDLDALQPVTIAPMNGSSALSAEDRARLTTLAKELTASIEQAGIAQRQAELNVKTALDAWKVAKATVTARKADVKAAKEQVKVDKLGTDAAAMHASLSALEAAEVELDRAEHAMGMRSLEHGVAKTKVDRAAALAAMEQAKLNEVNGRLAEPAMEERDLLKLEKDRAAAETSEAKARIAVSKAQAKVERERAKTP